MIFQYFYVVILLFCKLASSSHEIGFIMLGDWGAGGKNGMASQSLSTLDPLLKSNAKIYGNDESSKYTNQVAVAQAMGHWTTAVTNSKPSFIVTLGDNFYDNGVSSPSDPLWQTLWTDVYLTDHPSLRVPWYPVFGNHDYGYGATGVRAQIDRGTNHDEYGDDYWMLPSTNYSRSFDIPGGGSVHIVFVDTTTLAPTENKCCNSQGGVSEQRQQELIQNQLSHIDRMLKEAKAASPTWLLVVGHYPIFSAGSHGDTDELILTLLPLLVQYRVHAYICGHDHISEHLRYNGTEYFVSGAGAMTDSLGKTESRVKLLWYSTGRSAFTAWTASGDTLSVMYIDSRGDVLYDYVLTNPHHSYDNGNRRSSNSSWVLGGVVFGFLASLVLTAAGVTLWNFNTSRHRRSPPSRNRSHLVRWDNVHNQQWYVGGGGGSDRDLQSLEAGQGWPRQLYERLTSQSGGLGFGLDRSMNVSVSSRSGLASPSFTLHSNDSVSVSSALSESLYLPPSSPPPQLPRHRPWTDKMDWHGTLHAKSFSADF
eukprot:gene4372-8705_t